MAHRKSGHCSVVERRAAVAVEYGVVVVLISLFLLACWYSSRPNPVPDAYALVQVSTGGTLWEVAEGYTPNGESVARVVEMIRRENGLSDSSVAPGTTLRVPINARVDSIAMR